MELLSNRKNAPSTSPAPPQPTEAPPLDISLVRRSAQRGEPQTTAIVLALVERLERAEWNLSYAMSALQRTDRERLAGLDVVAAARAWADANVGQEIAEIERCANELMAAIARCE